MAITDAYTQVTWAAANFVSVTAASNQTSDVFTHDATDIAAAIEVKADNGGAPAAGSTVDFYWLQTLGDPDAEADVGDEYATVSHGVYLGTLDTNAEDPAIAVLPLPLPAKSGKLYAVNNDATNAITVSAQIVEKRAA